jgi:hypothetical protein
MQRLVDAVVPPEVPVVGVVPVHGGRSVTGMGASYRRLASVHQGSTGKRCVAAAKSNVEVCTAMAQHASVTGSEDVYRIHFQRHVKCGLDAACRTTKRRYALGVR